MAGSEKIWSDNNPPACAAADLNGFKLENNNLILGTGQVIDDTDNQQTHKAVSAYVGNGDFYNETGIADAYVLDPIGVKVAPPAYSDGMKIRFVAGNTNTGASTINVDGLGVKNLTLPDGTNPGAGDIVAGINFSATYDLGNGRFELDTPNPFGFSLEPTAASGHIQLPVWLGGFLLNWGTFSLAAPGSSSQSVVFDEPFSTTIFGAWVGVDVAADQQIGTSSRTLIGMDVIKGVGDPDPRTGTWYAIGK